MHIGKQESLFKTLSSETRLKIMDLLGKEERGLRFSKISQALDIHSSTLEDHLKRLVENGIISHTDNRYISTLNSLRFRHFIESISSDELNNYMSSHLMTIENRKLADELWKLDFTLMTDLLSIIRKAQTSFTTDSEWGFLGGSMNMRLEQSFFELWDPDLKGIALDAVFTPEGIEDIISMNLGNLFFDAVSPDKINIYTIPECNWAIAGNKKGGLLFLPDLQFKVDFTQCLCFESERGRKWLMKVFEHLKSRSSIINPKELRKILG